MAKVTEADEYLTSDGAARIARIIRDYWFDKGHFNVGVWVEPIRIKVGHNQQATTFYQVRSNLRNALPLAKDLCAVCGGVLPLKS